MNKYELLLIYKPNFENESIDAPIKALEVLIKDQKGKPGRVDRFGRKKLAYKVGKFREALMAVATFELNPAKIVDLQRQLKLQEDLLRFVLIQDDKLDFNKPATLTPVTGKEPREGGRGPRGGGGRFGGGGGRFGGGGGRFGGGGRQEGDHRGPRPAMAESVEESSSSPRAEAVSASVSAGEE